MTSPRTKRTRAAAMVRSARYLEHRALNLPYTGSADPRVLEIEAENLRKEAAMLYAEDDLARNVARTTTGPSPSARWRQAR